MKQNPISKPFAGLLDDIRSFIHSAKQNVAVVINSELVILYWNMGNKLRKEVLNESRAEYGKQVVKTLSKQLQAEFGRGYSVANLTNFIVFAEKFPDFRIIQTLSEQLSWSHFVPLIYLKNDLQREFSLSFDIKNIVLTISK